MIGFISTTYRLWVLGVDYLVISIPLVTSLFYLLRNSYRGVLVICSVPELNHPYLETRSGTGPQPFCHTLAGLISNFFTRGHSTLLSMLLLIRGKSKSFPNCAAICANLVLSFLRFSSSDISQSISSCVHALFLSLLLYPDWSL